MGLNSLIHFTADSGDIISIYLKKNIDFCLPVSLLSHFLAAVSCLSCVFTPIVPFVSCCRLTFHRWITTTFFHRYQSAFFWHFSCFTFAWLLKNKDWRPPVVIDYSGPTIISGNHCSPVYSYAAIRTQTSLHCVQLEDRRQRRHIITAYRYSCMADICIIKYLIKTTLLSAPVTE